MRLQMNQENLIKVTQTTTVPIVIEDTHKGLAI